MTGLFKGREKSSSPWMADLESGLDDGTEWDTGTESEESLILTADPPKAVNNVDNTPRNDIPLTIRPFPLGSPFFYSSDVDGAYLRGGDDSDVECISLPPPSSPIQDSDRYTVASTDGESEYELDGGPEVNIGPGEDNNPGIGLMTDNQPPNNPPEEVHPNVDPAALCPWCDQLLPEEVSPTLEKLMNRARKSSVEDERPENPFGLMAPISVASPVCVRHRFERNVLPLAQQHGWPQVIDWRGTYTRLRDLKHSLQSILDDADVDWKSRTAPKPEGEPQTYDSDNEYDEERRIHPRWGSIFWKSFLKAAHRSSVLHVAGLRGQMEHYESTSPGYYGEMGFEVIFHTLSELFPPTDIPEMKTTPLTGEQFLRLILVPEVSISLIMEDLGQTRSEALRTRSASVRYGEETFPEGDNEVVDEILRRRVAARREAERKQLATTHMMAAPDRKRRILKKRPRPQLLSPDAAGRESSQSVKKVRG